MIKKSFLALLCGLMLVQGGPYPVFSNEENVEEIFVPETESIIHSGKIGTADWTIDSYGTLTIGSGEFETDSIFYTAPWKTFSDEIKSVNGKAKFFLKGYLASTLFEDLDNLETADLSGWDISQTSNLNLMFCGCTSLKTINLSNWDTSNIEVMTEMFGDCSSLEDLNLSNWKVPKLRDTSFMFSGCSSLKNLNLSNWDTSNIVDMRQMFETCYELKNLNVSGWDTSQVRSMSSMFLACESLESLDLSGWNTSSLNEVDGMFAQCNKLKTLNLSNWNTSGITRNQDIENIFEDCESLYKINYTFGIENIISKLPSQFKWYQNDQGPYTVSKIPSLLQSTQVTLTREDHFDKSNFSTDTPSNGEMYRLYNPNSGEHFYTGNLNEKNQLSSIGWKYEGVAWHSPQSSNTPVYRLYNKNSSDHHYTTDPNERDTLVIIGWNDEGTGWYSDDNKGRALYRVYNPNTKTAGSHHYTLDSAEKLHLVSIGWKDEGIAWYGLK